MVDVDEVEDEAVWVGNVGMGPIDVGAGDGGHSVKSVVRVTVWNLAKERIGEDLLGPE